jgi:hypothetical protein
MLTFTWSAVFLLFLILLFLFIMKISGTLIKNPNVFAILALLLTLPSPIIMCKQNWNDHDRSGRYFARDFASDYLNSCEKNAILYTNGDNDTFPLWYAQEVEGIRTDVRVVNLSYLSADWYIKQMARKAYDSEPIDMILTENKYRQGSRDVVYLYDNEKIQGYVDLKEAINFVANDDPRTKSLPGTSQRVDYIPKHKFRLNVDSTLVFSNGTINSENASRYIPELRWDIRQGYLLKNHLMTLDFLASNAWKRPICYAITVSNENYLSLDNYFENHGLAYRLVPAMVKDNITYIGGINSRIMYDNMMNKFRWGGMDKKDLYIDENVMRMLSNIRYNFSNLAKSLIIEGKIDSARRVLDRCLTLMPDKKVPYDMYMIGMVECFYQIKDPAKAAGLANDILKNTYQDLDYLTSLGVPYSKYLLEEKQIALHILSELSRIADENGDKKFSASIQQNLETYSMALRRSM